ncbi:two-component system response regulator TctD [Limimaricola variabilis]|jgi:two-component system response regulator TctD|uniref:Two-component system response regulator TctD n=1 Tax=Limimaricola variabilis TaxID=1492771 RepID=A0ABR6HPS7_9RHOB|nr:response regulator transcription factor [Limimaricola variabilis]MBB3712364.1 two-component system response regulator TctD [Limimaricola variabilis]WPY94193.1 response regulator transcription factor [Limimaricola variabilis]
MRILIVEDTPDVAEAASASLGRAGFACDVAPTLADAHACAGITGYAAIVLDLNLPDGSGRDFLRERRRAGDRTPVLVLTAQFSVDERVAALDDGADDYLVKPFDLRELEARLRALTRREAGRAENRMVLGGLDFDPGAQSLRVNGAAVTATRRELALLNLLIANRGRIMPKDRLFDGLFGFENADVGTNTIELYVARLRKKLAGSGVSIETHRGLGYRLDLDG